MNKQNYFSKYHLFIFQLQVLRLAEIWLFGFTAIFFFPDSWKLYLLVWLNLNCCLASRWVMGSTVCVCEKDREGLLPGVLLTGFKSQQSSLTITNTPIQPINRARLKTPFFCVFIQETCTTEHVECLSVTCQKICLVCSCGKYYSYFFSNGVAYIQTLISQKG